VSDLTEGLTCDTDHYIDFKMERFDIQYVKSEEAEEAYQLKF
jgi:hypothetical protein